MKHLKLLTVSAVSLLFLSGCATQQRVEQKPRIVCDDCTGLVYYDPTPPPGENPFVSGLKVLASAGTQIAGYGFMADTAKSITSTVANAGKVQVVKQPAPTVVTQPAPVPSPDPTIVTQPEPIIVGPPDPIYAPDPTIVPPPNPIIVGPPDPIYAPDPIIVGPPDPIFAPDPIVVTPDPIFAPDPIIVTPPDPIVIDNPVSVGPVAP